MTTCIRNLHTKFVDDLTDPIYWIPTGVWKGMDFSAKKRFL